MLCTYKHGQYKNRTEQRQYKDKFRWIIQIEIDALNFTNHKELLYWSGIGLLKKLICEGG